MSTVFVLGLLLLPFLDIVSLIKAGALFGVFPTLALVVGAGVIGFWLARHQGLAVGRSVQATLAAGRVPVVEAFDGACLLIAGGLLLFPGLVSDGIALVLLVPPVRAALRRLIGRRVREQTTTIVWTTGADGISRPMAGGDIIDGDFEVVRPAAESTDPKPERDPRTLPTTSAKPPPTIVRPNDPC